MRRIFLAVVAGALVVLVGVIPALAQGEIPGGRWAGSQFADEDMRAGSATRSTKVVTVSGRFDYRDDLNRSVGSVRAEASDPAVAGCVPPAVGEVSLGSDGSAKTFEFTVSSACNVTTTITVTATTTQWLGDRETRSIASDLTFAAPPTAVTDMTAAVPDTSSKDVTVSWAYPENAAPDTSYQVFRAGPGGEDTWTSLTEELSASELGTTLTDTVETNGVYQFRVRAKRPHVEEPARTTVEVRVGEEPVTETPDTGSQSPVTQPGSASTITVPRLGSTRTPSRVSSHTTVTIVPQGPPTTIDTGFEETLDYDEFDDDDYEPGDLAAEGQSIIGSDDESVIGPGAVAASLLVMFGWAGHVVYVRRLAAQF